MIIVNRVYIGVTGFVSHDDLDGEQRMSLLQAVGYSALITRRLGFLVAQGQCADQSSREPAPEAHADRPWTASLFCR